ncbi:methionyl-tRNA formyltransferase [Ectothiorhodosinus mongolicus]|uniref:Methionyl-tRNA formyltransferase n=1 Tax=Ectothiorhodosinus mongolicus TaxID=233100 RepID=A0A1R3VZ15_9GAMM|nr:methionyl-tRNA formyltransferase [Ectothiorhodosinus mongolicus]ULX57068.1 methionyl-tRNA formyltransferase [Ectothiorhodosinus mongolicus]SIT69754.1 methionyl-tRNA formyltransferase [Ectothiorhodosinus mongolicus]
MRVVFAGTPEFAVPALQALIDADNRVVAVYTQPDRPAGRGRKLQASPVKQTALRAGIPVEQPPHFKDPEALARLAEYQPDLMVVAAYGLLLPQTLLDIPRFGCINIHASLLPRWRGAAPIQRALLAGDAQTGISLMQMEAGLDTGPVLRTQACAIEASDTAQSLHDRLAAIGADVLLQGIEDLQQGRFQAKPQDEALATYAKKLTKAEAEIDWTESAIQLDRRVRAYNPWPVAYTTCQGHTVRLWESAVQDQSAASPVSPGLVLAESAQGIDVATGASILRIMRLQWAGSKALSAAEFLAGRSLLGQRLGQP